LNSILDFWLYSNVKSLIILGKKILKKGLDSQDSEDAESVVNLEELLLNSKDDLKCDCDFREKCLIK
jgi:hypothetical protein